MLPRLGRFAVALTRSRQEADDLVQMTCERALSRAHQWQPGTRLDSWLYRIMQTIWLNEIHSRTVRRRHDEEHRFNSEPSDGGENAAATRVMVHEVERTLLQLKEKDRAILVLVCVEEMTYRETAEILGIPIGTVMSRLAKARFKLAQRLGTAGQGADNIVRLSSAGHD
jgi:RNA polymerase sigma-70 factor, ECF subfamily